MYALRTKLMFIRRKAENQRAATAMNELASYYKKLGEYIQAEECSELARVCWQNRTNKKHKQFSDKISLKVEECLCQTYFIT